MKLTDKINVTFSTIQKPLNTAHLNLNDFIVDLSDSGSFFNLQNEAVNHVGSSEGWLSLDWSDTLLFNKENLQLEALSFHIPETNVELDNLSEFSARGKKGEMRMILKKSQDFLLSPMSYRHYIEEEDLLICFNQFNLSLAGISEYKIANNVSVFEQNDLYVGWGVYASQEYLGFDQDNKQTSSKSSFLKQMFQKSLHIMETENFEKMIQKDLGVLKQLAQFYNEIAGNIETIENPALEALKRWTLDITDRYYWGTGYESYFEHKD